MKRCTKCGVEKDESCFDKERNHCKGCRKAARKEREHKNRKVIAARTAKYKLKWLMNNPEKRKSVANTYAKRVIADLSDAYVAKTLLQSDFPASIANNPEVIAVKRIIIKLKRYVKNKKNDDAR